MTTSLSVVVPAYNEESRLPVTLSGLSEALRTLPYSTEIVVVDNASTDRSAEIAAAHDGATPVRVLRCEQRGKGAAVRAGVLSTGSDFVGFCDADLATDVGALAPAMAQLEAGVNVVIGSRAHALSDVQSRHSLARRTGACLFRWSTRRIAPGFEDTQCGFKFFDRASAESAFRPLQTTGFAFDVEVLARAARHGAVIAEIPVRWVDVPASTFNPLHDGYESFSTLARIKVILAGEAATVRVPRPSGTPDIFDAAVAEAAHSA